jgi:hypothetical protein
MDCLRVRALALSPSDYPILFALIPIPILFILILLLPRSPLTSDGSSILVLGSVWYFPARASWSSRTDWPSGPCQPSRPSLWENMEEVFLGIYREPDLDDRTDWGRLIASAPLRPLPARCRTASPRCWPSPLSYSYWPRSLSACALSRGLELSIRLSYTIIL